MNVRARLAKLEASIIGEQTGYRLPDGTVGYIRSKKVYAAYLEACNGEDTPGARIMLTATECLNPPTGGRLHELAQSLQDSSLPRPCAGELVQ